MSKPITIPLDDLSYRSVSSPPSMIVSESEKTPQWYYRNAEWILSWYNRPLSYFNYPTAGIGIGATGVNNGQMVGDYYQNPVQFMIRMVMYYLGRQPNLNYNHLTQDIGTTNLQAQWIKGHDVSEFVDYFKGHIINRLANSRFSAKPMSKDSVSKYNEQFDKLMLKYNMKQFENVLSVMGVSFDPSGGQPIDTPEDIEKWMNTNYKEEGAILATNLANGIWFSNGWFQKLLQAFMHMVICSKCAMEHYVENGKVQQRVRYPWQLITDPRFDDDYGRYDQFTGVIDNMSPTEVFQRFPNLDMEQRRKIEEAVNSNELGGRYNTKNISWWGYRGGMENTVSVATVYWRTLRDNGKIKYENQYKVQKIRNKKKEEYSDYHIPDIHKCVIIGNMIMTDYGYVDNLVEDVYDKSKPLFPIIRFQPNTFMGESMSPVARIHRIQDEMDMYLFKIREMVGRAKGRVVVLDGSKYTGSPKEFFDDISAIGVSVVIPSGEAGDIQDGKRIADQLDMTLDSGIIALSNLYKECRDRMGKVMSTSEVAMGQQQRYIGANTQQATISQNTQGVMYLFDGFMDWVVMNMRYSVNQLKNLVASGGGGEIAMLVGDRGIKYMKITKDMLFEDMFIELNINDAFDKASRERALSIAQALAQNGQLDMIDFFKVENASSKVELEEELEYRMEKRKREQAKQSQGQNDIAAQMEQLKQFFAVQLLQLKEDNANFRTMYQSDMQAFSKGYKEILNALPTPPAQATINQPKQEELKQEEQSV